MKYLPLILALIATSIFIDVTATIYHWSDSMLFLTSLLSGGILGFVLL